MKKSAPKKQPELYTLGEVFVNPYLGNRIVEVISAENKRVGWVWTHTDGTIVASPHLGFYVWYDNEGNAWTLDTAAKWLAKKRR